MELKFFFFAMSVSLDDIISCYVKVIFKFFSNCCFKRVTSIEVINVICRMLSTQGLSK